MKQFKSGSLLFAFLYLFLFLWPSFASAHAYILKSTPYENEIVDQAPLKVTIEFDETIQASFNSLEVFDSAGNRVDQKNGRIKPQNPSIIETDLAKNLPNDTYSIKWRIVSSDGHPVEGVIPFQVGNDNPAHDSSKINKESKGYMPQLDLIIIRWLQYIGNACLAAMLLFQLFVLPKELREFAGVNSTFNKLLTISLITLSISILLSLPLQATIESGLSWSKVLNVNVLGDMLATTLFGETWIIQLILLVFLFISSYLLVKKRFHSLWVWISFVLGIGLLLTKAFTSHAASSTNVLITVSIDFIHLLSASIWIGSLIILAALIPLSRNNDTKGLYLNSIRTFSKWGIVLVIVLSFTGVYGSFSYIPNLKTLLTTNYGRVLFGKVILLVIMIIFASVNFIKGKRNKEKGLPVTIWGELMAGAVVIVLSVLLTNLPTAMASPGPFKETKTVKQERKITFNASPNIIGENTFILSLIDKNGQPMKDIEQATLTFTSLEMDMGEATKTLVKVKEGIYQAKGLNFNMAGRWNVHVHVLTKDLETLDTDFKVIVGSQ
ncbi:copper resistance protein CopC [Neobacillus drentensis]|uniref:copper resistance CopC/CopD family protein n=1 Tax=Neobacillus drentensis TaxID=220684 RepID=UPI002FFF4280